MMRTNIYCKEGQGINWCKIIEAVAVDQGTKSESESVKNK